MKQETEIHMIITSGNNDSAVPSLLTSETQVHVLTSLPVQLSLTSSTQKHKPIYTLKIRYEAPQTGARFMDDEVIEAPFTEWFNIHGYLDKKALRRWLAGKIEFVGLADPAAKKEWDDAREEERVDEEVVSEGAIRSGATAQVTSRADETATPGASAKKRGPGRPRKV